MKIVTRNFRYNWLSRNTDHLELDLQVLFSFHSLLDYTVCGVKLHAHSVFAAIKLVGRVCIFRLPFIPQRESPEYPRLSFHLSPKKVFVLHLVFDDRNSVTGWHFGRSILTGGHSKALFKPLKIQQNGSHLISIPSLL